MCNGRFTRRLTVGVLAERRYLGQRQPAALCTELRARGHRCRLIDPDHECEVGSAEWLSGLDVVVPRGRSHVLLSLVAAAEQRGVPVVNGHRTIVAVQNKLEMAVALAAAGVPTPATFAGSPAGLAEHVPAGCYPLVLKPLFGDNGRGLRIVADAGQLARTAWPEPAAIAQQLVPGDGLDLKLYGIRGHVWAVRRPSPLTPLAVGARTPGSIPLTDDLAELGRRCGELFGLDLYGVDCVETLASAVVIEVNEYPNYAGVAEADGRLADVVEWYAAR